MVVLLTAALLTRRVSHDDVHSVEGYHRSLHTLEEINAHPSVSGAAAGAGSRATAVSAYPESAVRLAGTSTVRVTDAPPASVPPVPLPLVSLPPFPPGADPDLPVTFDDDAHAAVVPVPPRAVRRRDKAM